jgi:hypothetical protein
MAESRRWQTIPSPLPRAASEAARYGDSTRTQWTPLLRHPLLWLIRRQRYRHPLPEELMDLWHRSRILPREMALGPRAKPRMRTTVAMYPSRR